jgi:hypothetical protein
MVAQWQGWPHRSGGDGGNTLHQFLRHGVVLGRRGVGGRTPFEGIAVLFRGARRGGGTGVDDTVLRNDTDLPAQHPHNARDGCTVRVGRTTLGSDSQAVSEDRRGGDPPLTRVPVMCQSHSMPQPGEQVRCHGSRAASGSLERGGNSSEGAPSPRARRRLRGAAPAPRARRRFARGVPRLAI